MGILVYVQKPSAPEVPFALEYDSDNSTNFNGTSLGIEDTADAGRSISVVNNTSLMVAWQEFADDEFDTSNSRVNIRNLDLVGSNNFSYQLSTLVCNWDLDITKLSDGNLMVAFTDQTGNPRLLRGAIISPTGSVTTGPTTIDGSVVDTETAAVGFASGGGAAVMYGDGNDGYTKIAFLNQFLSVTSTVNVSTSYEPDNPRGALLSNGNVAFVYKNDSSGAGNGLCIYTSAGSEVLNTQLISGTTSAVGNSIVACNDGGFVTTWLLRNGNFDYALYIRKHNASGTTVSTVTVSDPPTSDPGGGAPWDSWRASTAFKLDDGKIGLVGWSSGAKGLYVWVYDQDLNSVQSATLLKTVTTIPESYKYCSAGAFGNGHYGVAIQANGDSGSRVYLDVIKDNQ